MLEISRPRVHQIGRIDYRLQLRRVWVSIGVPNYHRFHESTTLPSIKLSRVRVLLLFD